jgi:hypothetical protein
VIEPDGGSEGEGGEGQQLQQAGQDVGKAAVAQHDGVEAFQPPGHRRQRSERLHAAGMMNLGTMMPPMAPIRMLPTPPTIVACSEVFARLAMSSAQATAARLTAAETAHQLSSSGRLAGISSASLPNSGTTNMPTSTINAA